MRIPRSIQLFNPEGFVHQFSRCHNREYYLTTPKMKSLYLNCIKRALKTHNKDSSIKVYAYTIMDNHVHNLMHYINGSRILSNFFRQAHSLFGMWFNKLHNRSGQVAEGRPKTSLIENTEHITNVHLYIEANPIRAGKYKERHLRSYKFSSYRFYAYGIEDEDTKILTVPEWYWKLGKSPLQRQHRYRSLFRKYLGEEKIRIDLFAPFIGSQIWILRTSEIAKELLLAKEDEKKTFSSA